jgi:hypothetical protein
MLFDRTAVYVLMIRKTIVDIMYFFLVFCIVVCAFANAIMVINKYERNVSSDDYEPIVEDAFGNDVTDSLINQYMVGLGEFSYDSYETNPSRDFLWVYFILATFLTQIVFFNMLITVMGTTYSEVIEFKDRHNLIAHTNILARYVYLCKLDQSKLNQHRYLYIAFRCDHSESTEQTDRVGEMIEQLR